MDYVLPVAGAAAISWVVYNSLSFACLYVRPSSLNRYLDASDGVDPWALITGASDGIGKAFANELAARGCNIVLHGRDSVKLERVKSQLIEHFPTREVRIVIADATDAPRIDYVSIAKRLADIKLKILINNVGSTMPREHEFDLLENYTTKELVENIDVNAVFPLLLTSALMPQLTAQEPSLILNIGSGAEMGMPLFPAYGPAKSFLAASTEELVMEQMWKKRAVEVLGLRALQVTNTGTIGVKESLSAPDAKVWVRSALARVGCGRPRVTPYLPHAIMAGMLEGMPSFMAARAKISTVQEQLKTDLFVYNMRATTAKKST